MLRIRPGRKDKEGKGKGAGAGGGERMWVACKREIDKVGASRASESKHLEAEEVLLSSHAWTVDMPLPGKMTSVEGRNGELPNSKRPLPGVQARGTTCFPKSVSPSY